VDLQERRAPLNSYEPLKRVVLTDGVGRTLFDQYAAHHTGARKDDETGWLLLGIRERQGAIVLATLPAGTDCDASAGHVRFNSAGQALGSRIVRQSDRRLSILGVVHTHPGSLRHPSDADYRGDSIWIMQLRGREGIFGIGTADGRAESGPPVVHQPQPNQQCLGKLQLSWYALGAGQRNYRPLPVGFTLGPDLARPLHPLWSVVDRHARELDRLCGQLSCVFFDVASTQDGPALAVKVPLPDSGGYIKVLLTNADEQFFVVRNGEPLRAELEEVRVDRAVYMLLAELAAVA
jgi:hypothetical protein